MTIIDAEYLIVGRIATVVAKKALLGEKIDIVNCEKAVMTGNKKEISQRYREKRERGQPTKGPFIPRRPDMFVRRVIRGMLPYKQEKGRKAFERIMCYLGVPDEFKDKKLETIEKANISKVMNLKNIPVGEICKEMGAKYHG